MKVEVAIGEIFDKITILDIKLARIQDNERLMYVRGERETLDMALINEGILIDSKLYEELKDINTKIWDTEAGFREKEAKKEFDNEFIEFARLNAKYNDERFLVKKRINEHYQCEIREQKSYDRLYTSD
mgnify:FL=1|jgi:hypothetical protein|tara:strand:+ start:28 stop:414 length:387 start_codon:yes stop_codon:yes gene_type:complete